MTREVDLLFQVLLSFVIHPGVELSPRALERSAGAQGTFFRDGPVAGTPNGGCRQEMPKKRRPISEWQTIFRMFSICSAESCSRHL